MIKNRNGNVAEVNTVNFGPNYISVNLRVYKDEDSVTTTDIFEHPVDFGVGLPQTAVQEVMNADSPGTGTILDAFKAAIEEQIVAQSANDENLFSGNGKVDGVWVQL